MAEDPFERHCEGVVSSAKCSLDEVEIGVVVRDLFLSCLFDVIRGAGRFGDIGHIDVSKFTRAQIAGEEKRLT